MRVELPAQAPSVEVELGGLGSDDGTDRVRARIRSLTRYAPRPILGATVRFSTPSGRVRTLVVAHATLVMAGARLVAFGTGATIGEATDRVRTTLRRQLLDLAHGRRKHSAADDPSTSDETPPVARHVTRMPPCPSVEAAVLALEQLDQEFGLYADTSDHRDAVVWREPAGEHGFAAAPTVTLTEAEAIQRLVLTGEPWVFYTDRGTGRGHIAHRREDHSYGVITP